MGYAAALQAGAALRNAEIVRLERMTYADEEAAWKLFQDRADKTYSRRLSLAHVLATDEHYCQEGFFIYP